MKTYKLFTLFILFTLVLVSACKKKEDVIEEPVTEPLTLQDEQLFLAFYTQEMAAQMLIDFGDSLNIDPSVAMELAAPYLRNLSGVESVFVLDSTYLRITTTGGYQSSISIDEIGPNGLSLYRGSPSGIGALKQFSAITRGSINKIENKKVLIYAAFVNEFYGSIELDWRVVDAINDSEAGIDVTVLRDAACVPEIIETFNQYGLVILDTHGDPDAILTGVTLQFNRAEVTGTAESFKQLLIAKIGLKYYNQYLAKQLAIGLKLFLDPSLQSQNIWNQFKDSLRREYRIKVTSKGIREVIPMLDSTVIFANCCYSAFTSTSITRFGITETIDPVKPAWMSKNPISLFAYEAATNGVSYKAENGWCKNNEDTLIHSFFYYGDSTGNAHMYNGTTISEDPWSTNIAGGQANQGPLRFNQYGRKTWSYDLCIDSIIDVRDNEVYKVVCIGDQIWMAENLRWAGAGSCYDGIQASCDTFGRLYTWNEFTGGIASSANPSGVQGICPDGWHVPSKPEWLQLMNAVGGQTVAGRELKANSALWVDAPVNTDTYGFSALPAGVCSLDSTLVYYCYNEDDFANFWSSSMIINDPVYYWIGSIDYMGELSSPPMYADKLSCRCVKD
jgi:uncharacterized protein (TIGR02145 family)